MTKSAKVDRHCPYDETQLRVSIVQGKHWCPTCCHLFDIPAEEMSESPINSDILIASDMADNIAGMVKEMAIDVVHYLRENGFIKK